MIATHHPPFTGSAVARSQPDHAQADRPGLQRQPAFSRICYLSGHAHLYERYTRTVGRKQIPYLVAGMGGYYNLPGLKPGKPPPVPQDAASGNDASGNPLTLEAFNDNTFGFLRMTVSPSSITGAFVTVDPSTGKTGVGDSFTVDLKANTVSNGASATAKAASAVSAEPAAASRTPARKASEAGSGAARTKAGSKPPQRGRK